MAAWSLREALIAYIELLRREARATLERARDRYMHDRKLRDEPQVPEILANDDGATL